MSRGGFVYMLASGKNGTIYIGVTSNLAGRLDIHKCKTLKSFTSKYDATKLVWYENFDSIEEAITREKQLKHWKRDWKIELIEKTNPNWYDLSSTLLV